MNKNSIVLIDDDGISNYLCNVLIKTKFPDIKLQIFQSSEIALDSLTASPMEADTKILLDINMPIMNAWEFLDAFQMKNLKCDIFILTSSTDATDEDKGRKYCNVKGFYTKPLTIEKIIDILKYI